MKKITVFLALVFCLAMSGCSKDADIEAFIKEMDGVTKDIVSKIDANPTAAGVDDAQKAFDARKAELKTKWDAIKDAVGMQVSEATKKKLEDSMKTNMTSLTSASMKVVMDPAAGPKLQKLIADYTGTFTTPGK
jgi:hypothetical protein